MQQQDGRTGGQRKDSASEEQDDHGGDHDPDHVTWREPQLPDYHRRYALWRDEQAKRFDADCRRWLDQRAKGQAGEGPSGSTDSDPGESGPALPKR